MSQVRYNIDIYLDDEKDKDIIKLIEILKSRHKLSSTITTMIKLICDNEFNKDVYNKLREDIDYTDYPAIRTNFFDSMRSELYDIKSKTDKMYELAYQTYITSLIGKKLDLETASKNTLAVEFMIEQNIKKLQDICGVNIEKAIFLADSRITDIDRLADSIMENIVNRYSGIVNEIKVTEVATIPAQVVNNVPVENIKNDSKVEEVKTEEKVDETAKVETNTENKDEEVIDFGDADFDALENFFGGN